MIRLRKARDRGHATYDWLDTHHTFSFFRYYDPEHMNFRSLRVMNEDVVAPGRGFGWHPHDNMEIFTVVLSGRLRHRDSAGNEGVLEYGDVQAMSAGTGIYHSEENGSDDEPVHFYQIWIMPAVENAAPRHGQIHVPREEKLGAWRRIVSGAAGEGELPIHQDAHVYQSILEAGGTQSFELASDRHAWLQVLRGAVDLNGQNLSTSDGAGISGESELTITAEEAAEVLMFDIM